MINIMWNRRKALNWRRMRVEAQLWKRLDQLLSRVLSSREGADEQNSQNNSSSIASPLDSRGWSATSLEGGRRSAISRGLLQPQRWIGCIWVVNEHGENEQTTDRKSLLKFFSIEHLSREGSLFRRRPRLRKIRAPSSLERLNSRSSVEAYEGAKGIVLKDDPRLLSSVVRTLLQGKRALNRAAAAYALNLRHEKADIPALERTVANRGEHPKVRGQAAESLAHNHRPASHRILRENLNDTSKEVRFWCAYSLAEMGDEEALIPLKELAQSDHRSVRGFWSVSREAKAAIRSIREKIKKSGRRRKACLFCSKVRARPYSRKSHA
jgi:HEAT repeat protein